MRKLLFFVFLLCIVGVSSFGQLSNNSTHPYKDRDEKASTNVFRMKAVKVDEFKGENSTQQSNASKYLIKQGEKIKINKKASSVKASWENKTTFPTKTNSITPSVSKDGQCAYTFNLIDLWGDGWNDAIMLVIQDEQLVAVLGPEFEYGSFYSQMVTLNHNQDFQVFWSEGGEYPDEVGLEILDAFGEQIYIQVPVDMNLIGQVIFSETAFCTPPTCPRPISLGVSNITSNSVDLEWVEVGGATTWDIEWGISGFTPGTGTMIYGHSATQYSLTGLDAATHYEFRVRAVCSQEDMSAWTNKFPFTTLCEPFTVPFFENFDNTTTPTLPMCWTPVFGGMWGLIETTDYVSFSNPNSVVLVFEETSTALLALPQFSEDVSNLNLYFSGLWWSGKNVLEVGVLTNTSDESSFIPVESITLETNWSNYSVSFASYSGPFGHIAFRFMYDDSNYWGAVLVDDIFVDTQSDCPSPYQLSISNLSYSTVTLQWSPFGEATQWEVEWGVEGFLHGEGNLISNVSEPFIHLANLEPGTDYQFYVRSVCDEGVIGNWSIPFSFRTYNEGECFYTFILHDTYGDGWNESLMLVLQNGEVVATLGENFWNGNVFVQQVMLNEGLDFEVFWAEGGYYPEEVGLEIIDPFNDQLYFSVPLGWGYVGTVVYTDMANCTPPTCPRPKNLTASNITTNTAMLNWSEQGSASTWDIEYGEFGFEGGEGIVIEGITTKPYILTGLESGTVYQFRVRSVCSDEDISIWSNRLKFTTQCEPIAIPYSENFDGVNPPELPACWQPITFGGNNLCETNNYFSNSSPNSIVLLYDYFNEVYLVGPQFQEDYSQLRVKFKALHYDGDNILQVGIMTDPSNVETFELLGSLAIQSYMEWSQQVFYLSQYSGTNGNIAFRFGDQSVASFGIVLIDDFEVEFIPSCPEPYNLWASDISSTFAVLGWSDVGAANKWDLEWGISPFTPGSGNLVQNITNTFLELDGLNPSTNYQFYVRSVCSDTETSQWSTGYSFTTGCGAVVLPFFENFDNVYMYDIPECWGAYGEGWDYFIGAGSWSSYSPPFSIALYHSEMSVAYLSTPEVSIPLSSVRLKFKGFFLDGLNNVIAIGTVDNPNNPSSFTPLQLLSFTEAWQEYEVSFEQYTGNQKHIAFRIGELNIDRWGVVLIDDVLIELAQQPTYSVNFTVTSHSVAVEGAAIQIVGQAETLYTNHAGQASHSLPSGVYQYSVTAEGHHNHEGQFTISDANVSVAVNLIPSDEEIPYQVTFIVQSTNDEPIEGAVIFIDGLEEALVTGFDGLTEVELTNGTYAFVVSADGYLNYNGSFVVEDADVTITIEMVSTEGYYLITFNVKDADGQPVENASITFTELSTTIITNSSGIASVQLQNGTYQYSIVASGFVTSVGEITVANQDQDVNITLTPEVTLYLVTFNVKNPQQEAVAGATISVSGSDAMTTDVSGIASQQLPSGDYSFTVEANEFQTYQGSFSIDNAPVSISIILTPTSAGKDLMSKVLVYPNPFGDVLRIENAVNVRRLVLSNGLGQQLYVAELNGESTFELNTRVLPSGLYLLEIQSNEGGKIFRKVIKR